MAGHSATDNATSSSAKQAAASASTAGRTPRSTPWNRAEELSCMRHMTQIVRNESDQFQGEDRFRETARRMQADGFARDFGGIKNYWNRKGRQESGVDERRKKSHPLATSKQDAASKAQRQRRSSEKDEGVQRDEAESDEEIDTGVNDEDDGASDILEGDADTDTENACVCDGRNRGDMMLACVKGGACVGREWYHFGCAGLKYKRVGYWLCDFCRLEEGKPLNKPEI